MAHEQQPQPVLGHLRPPPWVRLLMNFGAHQESTCFCTFWELRGTRLAWSPSSLGSPGFPFAHLPNDLQPTNGLSWAPRLEFGLNYTQQKRSSILETCIREGKKKKRKKKAKYYQLPPFRLVSERKRRRKKKSWVKSQFSETMTSVEFEQQGVYSGLKKHPNAGQEATGSHSPRQRQPRCYGNHQASFSPFPQVRLCLRDAVPATQLSRLKSCPICQKKSSAAIGCPPQSAAWGASPPCPV